MEPTRKDHNLKHLSVLTFLVFAVGFVVMWMLASVIWGMLSKSERENTVATNYMEKQLNAAETIVGEESLLDNLDVDQSTNEVMGASTGDPELDTQIRDLNSLDLNSVEKDYR